MPATIVLAVGILTVDLSGDEPDTGTQDHQEAELGE